MKSEDFKNILIFRTDRIGDLILTCPIILSIKQNFKNCKITLVTSTKNFNYAKNLNLFDRVVFFPDHGFINKIKFIRHLSKEVFDYIFIFDGKDRSIYTSSFIKSKNKFALIPNKNIKYFCRFFNIKYYLDNYEASIHEIFSKLIILSKLKEFSNNFNFLQSSKDNNFSYNIKIKNYIYLHLDEKWFKKMYIKNYTDINPLYDDFINFISTISKKDNILITTGLINLELVDKLKNNFFEHVNKNIFHKKISNFNIYLIDKPSFKDIESMLRQAKTLVACHGAITHASNSFQLKIIDIIEEEKVSFYKRFTSYIYKYESVYRNDFSILKNNILDKIN